MGLSPEAERDHRLLRQHTMRAVTEQFRQARMDDLNESDITKCTGCGCWKSVHSPCSVCAGLRNHSRTESP